MLFHRPLTFHEYLNILSRRRWVLLVPIVLMAAAGLGVTHFLAPTYLSQTLVLIEQQKVPDEYVKPVISSDLDSRLASMKEQILSRSHIQPIIDRYGLYPSKRYTSDDRVDLARKAITIKPIHSEIAHGGGLPGFFISFTSSDAHTAQLVCGEITSLFLNENLRSREASAEGTTDFLKGQLADAKRYLDEQDVKLAAFQHQYLGKLPGEESSNINMLTSLNTQLEAATQALARMQQDKSYEESMLAQQSREFPAAKSARIEAGSPDEQQLLKLKEEEADLLSRYTSKHPDVIAVRRKIADLKLHPSASDVVVTDATAPPEAGSRYDSLAVQQLRAQVRAADIGIKAKQNEQKKIQGAVSLYQERIQSSPLVEEQYKELTRDYETAKKFYDDLLTKMNQSKMATDLERRQQGEQFRVMDEPNLPDAATFPKRWIFASGGLMLGLLFGLLVTAFLEYRDTKLRTELDITAFTGLPILGFISQYDSAPYVKRPTLLLRPFARWKSRKSAQLLPGAPHV